MKCRFVCYLQKGEASSCDIGQQSLVALYNVQRVTNKGATIEPPGTPHEVGSMSEKQFTILMTQLISPKYEEPAHCCARYVVPR